MEYGQPQGQIYVSFQGFLTFIVQVVGSHLQDLRGRYKQLFKKTTLFSIRKKIGQLFSNTEHGRPRTTFYQAA